MCVQHPHPHPLTHTDPPIPTHPPTHPLHSLKSPEQDASLEKAIDAALQSVKLGHKGNARVGGYSGGMKRRLSVAISLIGGMIDEIENRIVGVVIERKHPIQTPQPKTPHTQNTPHSKHPTFKSQNHTQATPRWRISTSHPLASIQHHEGHSGTRLNKPNQAEASFSPHTLWRRLLCCVTALAFLSGGPSRWWDPPKSS